MKKTVIITGATDGIGKALAILLSKEYNLALCGRNEDKMKQLTQNLGDCHVYAQCFDITDREKRHTFCENVKIEEYIYNMPELMTAADVVVSRAGAMTLSEDRKSVV